MARMAGILLVLLAGALIALGSPLCCILGVACCGARTTTEATPTDASCCPHCKPEQPAEPAPKPCEDKKGCVCKHDVAPHAPTSAEYAPLVATFDVPTATLPGRLATRAESAPTRAAPAAQAARSLPLLL